MTLYAGNDTETLTPAESTRHAWQVEEAEKARDHDLKTRAMELKVLQRQTSWGALLRIPEIILKLPLYIVLGLGFCIAMVRGIEPSENFWELLK